MKRKHKHTIEYKDLENLEYRIQLAGSSEERKSLSIVIIIGKEMGFEVKQRGEVRKLTTQLGVAIQIYNEL